MIGAALLLGAMTVAEEPRTVPVVVLNCYTRTPAIEVQLDGKWLALTPAEKRDDSVGTCYDGQLRVTPAAHVRLRRAGQDRVFDLILTAKTKEIVVDATSMTAIASDHISGLD